MKSVLESTLVSVLVNERKLGEGDSLLIFAAKVRHFLIRDNQKPFKKTQKLVKGKKVRFSRKRDKREIQRKKPMEWRLFWGAGGGSERGEEGTRRREREGKEDAERERKEDANASSLNKEKRGGGG